MQFEIISISNEKMNDKETYHFGKKFEEKPSIREVEILSEQSQESYDIAPYSMHHEPPLEFGKIVFGVFFGLLGICALTVGVKKKIFNNEFNGNQYWLASFSLLCIGIGFIYHALKKKYSVLENYS